MIVVLTTFSNADTHRAVAGAIPGFKRMSYRAFFARPTVRRATYIFADLDRLGFWQLECAAHAHRSLRAAGCHVLNDPARALQRLGLLRRLHRLGINRFRAWPAIDVEDVDRFPVFLRTASAHRGPLTELIDDGRRLQDALEDLLDAGYPLSELMAVEYRAEPIRAGVFRKHAAYRIGGEVVASASVHEGRWAAKGGQDGLAGAEGYAEDLELLKGAPHARQVMAAFEAADIEYGRADFGVVDGRPEIYEINTNPMVSLKADHADPARSEALRLTLDGYLAAMRRLDDTPAGPRVRLAQPELFRAVGRRWHLVPGYGWTP
ncbi:hypothetical protein [Acuticoccus sp.]|uniref:hypothetical protein n=1 Tax=Acuticoccus sp. TaxID=1904378 RepID=UPI003B525AEF